MCDDDGDQILFTVERNGIAVSPTVTPIRKVGPASTLVPPVGRTVSSIVPPTRREESAFRPALSTSRTVSPPVTPIRREESRPMPSTSRPVPPIRIEEHAFRPVPSAGLGLSPSTLVPPAGRADERPLVLQPTDRMDELVAFRLSDSEEEQNTPQSKFNTYIFYHTENKQL